jgi:hypothetical protein
MILQTGIAHPPQQQHITQYNPKHYSLKQIYQAVDHSSHNTSLLIITSYDDTGLVVLALRSGSTTPAVPTLLNTLVLPAVLLANK